MALAGKIETVLELKSSPEKFFNVWRKQSFHVPRHSPKISKALMYMKVTGGTVKIWKYTIDGKREIFKEKVEFDDVNKTITINDLEGDPMKLYKVFKSVWQLTPKGSGSLAKCSIEYEKQHWKIPVPEIFILILWFL